MKIIFRLFNSILIPVAFNAVPYIHAYAWKESPEDLYVQGNYYFVGEGVKMDKAKAIEYWMKAARNGHAEAQYSIASCFDLGVGIANDKARAFYWYKKAADQGNADAQCQLAKCYFDGLGVTPDFEKGMHWLGKAIATKKQELSDKHEGDER